MGYRLTFNLVGVPELPNAIGRKHWSVKSDHARFWRMAVVAAVACKAPPAPLVKARVRIEVWRKGRPDPDNLVASIKPLLDGLQPSRTWLRRGQTRVVVGAGVIEDDKPENFEGGRPEVIGHQCKRGKKPRVVVTVEEVATAPVSPRGGRVA